MELIDLLLAILKEIRLGSMFKIGDFVEFIETIHNAYDGGWIEEIFPGTAYYQVYGQMFHASSFKVSQDSNDILKKMVNE